MYDVSVTRTVIYIPTDQTMKGVVMYEKNRNKYYTHQYYVSNVQYNIICTEKYTSMYNDRAVHVLTNTTVVIVFP